MSGGIAYVYDVKGKFKENCNLEMVELEECNLDDKNEIFSMIQKHFEYTGSTVAKFVLDDFNNQLKNFVKVFPTDYKKALLSQKSKVKVSG
jgi:glutamate synthase (NADPH) large chain